ncbi:hypothetical protein EYC80_008296 [Monilinia laxa]|uniref:Uncharacterized protein n=1 Tax=Monilinia laxa TaxID=61186 RepID=A0A5N6JSR4_MONLA|nr:hypothetical protein EYC80_008296 [Monilinia laxa]
MASEAFLRLKQCHLLNRLGEADHVCAILDDRYFTTILPGREVLHHTTTIRKFMIEGASGEQQFFGIPDSIELEPHTVIALTYAETLCLDIYPNDPEYTELKPAGRVELPRIEPDRLIDTSVGKLHQNAQDILEKAIKRLDLLEAPLKTRPDLPKFKYSPAATRVLLGLNTLKNPSTKALPPPAPPVPMMMMMKSSFAGAESADESVEAKSEAPTVPQGESLADVMAILSDDKKPAADQVKDGVAPKPPTIALEPDTSSSTSDDDKAKAYEMFTDSNKLSGLGGLFQAILKVQKMQQDGRKTPYSITDPVQASLAFDENANNAWQVTTGSSVGGGLAGYYMLPGTDGASFSKDVEKSNFTLNFTNLLFAPYGIETDKEKQIAGVIQEYIQAVASIKLDSSDTKRTVSHFIPMNLVQHINISGDDSDKLMVYQPRVKFFYLHIDGEAYTQSISTCWGSESTERFKFTMNYAVFQADINWEEIEKNSDKLDKVFQILSNENLDAYVAEAGVIAKVAAGDNNPQPSEPNVPGPIDPGSVDPTES